MQIHLYTSLIIERKMREAGQDPDAEPEPVQTLETAADLADFFG